MAADFQIVINKPDRTKPHGHQQNRPDIAVRQVRPQQRAKSQRQQDQKAAHCRGTLLGDDMTLRAIIANRLAAVLLGFQPVNDFRPQNKTDQYCRQQGTNASEG